MQAAYDLAQVEKHVGKIKVRRVKDVLISACSLIGTVIA
jgi:hypothetical protein